MKCHRCKTESPKLAKPPEHATRERPEAFDYYKCPKCGCHFSEVRFSSNKLYCFFEPHITGGTAHISLTPRQMINAQREAHPNRYKTDQAALDDFIVIHWAEECNHSLR